MENQNEDWHSSRMTDARRIDRCEMGDPATTSTDANTCTSSLKNSAFCRKGKKFSRIRLSGDLLQRLRGHAEEEDEVAWELSGRGLATPLAGVHTGRSKKGVDMAPQDSDKLEPLGSLDKHESLKYREEPGVLRGGTFSEDEGISDLVSCVSLSREKSLVEKCDSCEDPPSLTSLQWDLEEDTETLTQDGRRCSSDEDVTHLSLDIHESEEDPASSSASSDSGAGVSPDFITQEGAICAVTHCFSWLEDEVFALEPQTDLAEATALNNGRGEKTQAQECEECDKVRGAEERLSDNDEWEVDEDFEFTPFRSLGDIQRDQAEETAATREELGYTDECFDWGEEHYIDDSGSSDDARTPEALDHTNGRTVSGAKSCVSWDDADSNRKEHSKCFIRRRSHDVNYDNEEGLSAVDQARRISDGQLVCELDHGDVTALWRPSQPVDNTARFDTGGTGNQKYMLELRNWVAATNTGKEFNGDYAANSGEALAESVGDGSCGSLSESEWSEADTCVLRETFAHPQSGPSTGESEFDDASNTSSSDGDTDSDTRDNCASYASDATWHCHDWPRLVVDSKYTVSDACTTSLGIPESRCSSRSDLGSSSTLLGYNPALWQPTERGATSADLATCQSYCKPAPDTPVPHPSGTCLGCLMERDRCQQVVTWKAEENCKNRMRHRRMGDKFGKSVCQDNDGWLDQENRRWYRVGHTSSSAPHNGPRHQDDLKVLMNEGHEKWTRKAHVSDGSPWFDEKDSVRWQEIQRKLKDSSLGFSHNDNEFPDAYHANGPFFTSDNNYQNYQAEIGCQAWQHSGEKPSSCTRPEDTGMWSGYGNRRKCPAGRRGYDTSTYDHHGGEDNYTSYDFHDASTTHRNFRGVNLNTILGQNVLNEEVSEDGDDTGDSGDESGDGDDSDTDEALVCDMQATHDDNDTNLATQTHDSLDFLSQYQGKYERDNRSRVDNDSWCLDIPHNNGRTGEVQVTNDLTNQHLTQKNNKSKRGKTYFCLRPFSDVKDEENDPGTNKILPQWSVREKLGVNGRPPPATAPPPAAGVYSTATVQTNHDKNYADEDISVNMIKERNGEAVCEAAMYQGRSVDKCWARPRRRDNTRRLNLTYDSNICQDSENGDGYCESMLEGRVTECCDGTDCGCCKNSCNQKIQILPHNNVRVSPGVEGVVRGVADSLHQRDHGNGSRLDTPVHHYHTSPRPGYPFNYLNFPHPAFAPGACVQPDMDFHPRLGSGGARVSTNRANDREGVTCSGWRPRRVQPSVDAPGQPWPHGLRWSTARGGCRGKHMTAASLAHLPPAHTTTAAAATDWERSRDKFWSAVKFAYPSGGEHGVCSEADDSTGKRTLTNEHLDKMPVPSSDAEGKMSSLSPLQRRLSIPASCLSHSLCSRYPLYRKIQEVLCRTTKDVSSAAPILSPEAPVLTQPTSILKNDLGGGGSRVEGHWQGNTTTPLNQGVIDHGSEPSLPQETRVEASLGDNGGGSGAPDRRVAIPSDRYSVTHTPVGGLAQREPPDGTATPSAPVGRLRKLSETFSSNTHERDDTSGLQKNGPQSLSFEDTTLRSTCKNLWDPGTCDRDSHLVLETRSVLGFNTPEVLEEGVGLPRVPQSPYSTRTPCPRLSLQKTSPLTSSEQVDPIILLYPEHKRPPNSEVNISSFNPNSVHTFHRKHEESLKCVARENLAAPPLHRKTHAEKLTPVSSELINSFSSCRRANISQSYPTAEIHASSPSPRSLNENTSVFSPELRENGNFPNQELYENPLYPESLEDKKFFSPEYTENCSLSPGSRELWSSAPELTDQHKFPCTLKPVENSSHAPETQGCPPTLPPINHSPTPEYVESKSSTLNPSEQSLGQESIENYSSPLAPEPRETPPYTTISSEETYQASTVTGRTSPARTIIPEATSQQSSILLAIDPASEKCSSLVDLMKLGNYEGYITLPMTFKTPAKCVPGHCSEGSENACQFSDSEGDVGSEECRPEDVRISTQVRVSVKKYCKRRRDGSRKLVIKFTLCLECAGCKEELVEGQALIALDQQWHIWCFKCAICSTVLHGEYMGKDGLPYCEKDYQAQFGVKCAYCNRFISGKVLQAGDNHHFHPTCARCTKCGDPFGDGEEMYLQGTAIWHPRCGPGPTENGTVLNGSLSNGHHINGEQKTERERDFDGMSSTASETQFSRSRTPSLNGSFRSYSPYNSLNRKFSGPYRTCSPGLILREYKSSQSPIDITRIYTYSYLAAEPSQGYLKRPLDPYDRPPPKSPHFHRPPTDYRKLSLPKTSSRLGMRVLVDQMQAETPRPKSPHMNNEEPIILSHYPGGRKPSSGDVSRIERDDFPAPPYPYTDPERRRRWSGSNKAVSIDETDEGTEIDEDSVAEDPKLKREEVELSKIATGIGKVFLQQVKEREKIRAWKATHLDPRNASRTPAADREPGNKLRFGSSLNASPSRMTDHSRPWGPEDDEFDRGSSYRCSTGRSSATIPSYNVVSSLRQPPKPGYGFSPRNTFYRQGLGSYSALHGDYSFSGLGEKTQSTEFSSARSDVSAGSLTEADRSALNAELCASATYSSGLRGYSSYSPHLRRSLPNMHHMSSEPPKIYPAHLLLVTNYRLPNDVDRCHLERHLSDTDFEMVFHMTRMDFYRLPEWRRNDLKRRSKFF
nr:uncharacterized protein LOC123746519 isoform X3 [Procambarus clarkii]